jgi:hypothetical protein
MTAAELIAIRHAYDLSRRELAELTGYSLWTIKGYEVMGKPIPQRFEVSLKNAIAGVEKTEVADEIAKAILCLRGVEGVEQIDRAPDDYVNRLRIRNDLREKIWAIFKDI